MSFLPGYTTVYTDGKVWWVGARSDATAAYTVIFEHKGSTVVKAAKL